VLGKFLAVSVFSLLSLVIFAAFSFAESPEGQHGNKAVIFTGSAEQTKELESYPGLEMKDDGFGGYLYSYRDEKGNKFTTNSLYRISKQLKLAQAPLGAHLRAEPLAKVSEAGNFEGEASEDFETPGSEELEEEISDPLEPLNRAFFHFNDKLYFWFVKPVATGYKKVVPETLRVGLRNFFSNLFMPARAINCLLQGKVEGFGIEIARFLVNTTVGVCGFSDAAKTVFNMEMQDEDFGQTLGFYGIGPGIYINWPFLGPSSIRDTFGFVGDGLLNPVNYAVDPTKYTLAIKGYDQINRASLSLGEYEALKRAAFDSYISLREAYHENRNYKIRE
jgi:phospholipid-binding lipoprotein MlaA